MGEYNVDRMLRRMTYKQLVEWQVFDTLEPFGPERADQRMGALIMVMANAHRNSKTHPSPWTLAECVPTFGDSEKPRKAPMDWRAMKALAQAMVGDSRAARAPGPKKVERVIGRKLR
jgi:hypothetical protein